jgi:hypothetical protein
MSEDDKQPTDRVLLAEIDPGDVEVLKQGLASSPDSDLRREAAALARERSSRYASSPATKKKAEAYEQLFRRLTDEADEPGSSATLEDDL